MKLKKTNFELTTKKHWSTFTVPAVLILIGFFMLAAFSFVKYVGIALIIFNAIKILSLKTVKWTLTSNELNITKGILPWAKTEVQIPIFDIYESLVSFGMFGHFFGYGNITIRRTEGITSQITETSLIGAKNFSAEINNLVQQYKKNKHNVTANQLSTTRGVGEELRQLVDLKNNGELTQQEYDEMKQKIISRA